MALDTGAAVGAPVQASSRSAPEPAVGSIPAPVRVEGPAEAEDLSWARYMAQSQGRGIEALSERTADSTTFVNPDGSLTTEAFTGPIRVLREDGVWRQIDTTLALEAGDLKPVTTVADVAFSDGRDRRLAAVRYGGRTFGMDWPTALPEPVVDGSSAAYALGGGATLNVTALPQGFEQTIVLDEDPGKAPSYRIPMRLEGLELSKDARPRSRRLRTVPRPWCSLRIRPSSSRT
ncbi:hypothetical protein ACF09J_17590 [Streptomyces sp. NPDC014889]|uniref:hypothetical protein n=1 Tax=Streptomyces sp. NPDC014889 TaxID=3364928 RepID=UPI00370111D0